MPGVIAAIDKAKEHYSFPSLTYTENISIRPNGQLVLSAIANGGRVYTLDPFLRHPEAQAVVFLPSASGTTGIAQTAPDMFAIVGGYLDQVTYRYVENTFNVYNGITALPGYCDVVLGTDSAGGRILRIDLRRETIEPFFPHASLGWLDTSPVPLGVNGNKVFAGYLYFSNSALGTCGRIPMSPDGRSFGAPEIIAELRRSAKA
ncbi:hypothetical protein GQ53DRAFT_821796 [Thozetella sp. PMI_491]|nr:hypothetical protein GQ53DRAFT_821796 [Thozetella sp. PMI_491]